MARERRKKKEKCIYLPNSKMATCGGFSEMRMMASFTVLLSGLHFEGWFFFFWKKSCKLQT